MYIFTFKTFRLVAESIYLHKPGYWLKYTKQNLYLNQTSSYLVGSLEEEIALLWLESGTVPLNLFICFVFLWHLKNEVSHNRAAILVLNLALYNPQLVKNFFRLDMVAQ